MEYETETVAKFFNKTPDYIRKWAKKNNVKTVLNTKNKIKYVFSQEDIDKLGNFFEKVRTKSTTDTKGFKKTTNIYTLYKRLERARKKNQTERIQLIKKEIKEMNELNTKNNSTDD